MAYNIIAMNFSNETIEAYQQGIDDLLDIYANETEPFVIIGDYTDYKDNDIVPRWLRLKSFFRTWSAAKNSQWARVYIAINPTVESNFFLRWCQQTLSNQWTVYIATDIEDAYRIANDESILNLHQ